MHAGVRYLARVPLCTAAGVSSTRLCWPMLFMLAALADSSAAQAPADAASREFTVYAQLTPATVVEDAVSREFTAYVDLTPTEAVTNAISREWMAFNDLEPVAEPEDAVSREVVAFNQDLAIEVTSSAAGHASPVFGTLLQQFAALNAVPPPFDPGDWLPVQRKNENLDDAFLCGPDALTRPFVSADVYLDDYGVTADEVTLDNCGSAFYRFTFTLPPDAAAPAIYGSANADDQGVVWLNAKQLSALMVPGCAPANPDNPLDPCYLDQDAGADRTDAQGRRVLTWPTLDPFESADPNAFVPGENVLVFAVAGDAQAYEPTGVEFAAVVVYFKRGDVNCDGQVTFRDIDPFVAALGGANAYTTQFPHCRWLTADTNCDGAVTFADIDPFVACLGGTCACPQ